MLYMPTKSEIECLSIYIRALKTSNSWVNAVHIYRTCRRGRLKTTTKNSMSYLMKNSLTLCHP